MSNLPQRIVLKATPGDILLSYEAIPYPGAILRGFRKRQNVPEFAPKFEPFVDFNEIQKLLEFLEHVVLCERLIVPIPRLDKKTKKLAKGRETWVDFAVFRFTGDLNYGTDQLVARLEDAGVLTQAEVHVGESTADDFVSSRIVKSQWMQKRFAEFLARGSLTEKVDETVYAKAKMAIRIGIPLHTAEAAGTAGVPFILGAYDAKEISGYEMENLRVRRSVTQVLLDRLNKGARREIEKLSELGPAWVFPETPIARLIVDRASSVNGLVDAALALRNEFADFRRIINEIEFDLVADSQPLSRRLKRLRELEALANSLWKASKTDFRTTALTVSEALFAVPEATAIPSANSIKELASKLLALPVEHLISVYRRRKVRLLMKAKRKFLQGDDATSKLAHIFGVPEEIARKSRHTTKPELTSGYVKANPEMAAAYYQASNAPQGGA